MESLGTMLHSARTGFSLSLQEVAVRAGCSGGYVHKLEADRVKTPSPRVLARLAEALGLDYGVLMTATGYAAEVAVAEDEKRPGAVKRFSNAHIVELLEGIQRDIREIKAHIGP
jgi:transcriptional regulator with XRE-family HTH domain